MKTRFIGSILILSLLLTAQGIANDTTNPSTNPVRITPSKAASQNPLQVYTAKRKAQERDLFLEVYIQGHQDLETYELAHTDYAIYSDTGKLIKKVRNARGRNDDTPALVTLPPGSYQVKAIAQDYAPVTIPLTIQEGQTTVVYLDRDWRNTALSKEPVEMIQLPEGTLVYTKQAPARLAQTK